MTSILVIITFLITYAGLSFFESFTDTIGAYGGYVDHGVQFEDDRSIIASLLIFLINVVLLFLFIGTGMFHKKQFVTKKEISVEYICRMSFVFTFLLSIVGFTNNMMDRVSSYFSIFLIIMIPLSMKAIKRKDQRFIFMLLIMLSYSTKLFVQLIYRPNWNHVVPYEFGISLF